MCFGLWLIFMFNNFTISENVFNFENMAHTGSRKCMLTF